MSETDISKEWVGTAWTRYLRNETIREKSKAVAEVATVGIWLATYADADGTNAFPSRETLSDHTGMSVERVGKAIDVLVKVRMLVKKRRPNLTPSYTLLIPLDRPEWGDAIHLFTETRNKKKHRDAKAVTVAAALEKQKTDSERAHLPYAARTASALAVRKVSVTGVPDSERAHLPEDPDSERAHPRTASALTFRKVSATGGDQAHLLTEDQSPDHDRVAVGPQPADARALVRSQMDAEIFRKIAEGEPLTQLDRVRHNWLRKQQMTAPSEVVSVV